MLARCFSYVTNVDCYKNSLETAVLTESWTGSWRDNLHATSDDRDIR
jgi:hypothetical protein